MRILYKTLASVGMILLSTAAAFGIRHIKINNQKRSDPAEPSSDIPTEHEPKRDESLETHDSSGENTESSNDISRESVSDERSDDSHEASGE